MVLLEMEAALVNPGLGEVIVRLFVPDTRIFAVEEVCVHQVVLVLVMATMVVSSNKLEKKRAGMFINDFALRNVKGASCETCLTGYTGLDCLISCPMGYGASSSQQVCSGQGNCTSIGECTCFDGFEGRACGMRYFIFSLFTVKMKTNDFF